MLCLLMNDQTTTLTQYNDIGAKTNIHDRDRRLIWILTTASYWHILGTEQICDCRITWSNSLGSSLLRD